MKATQLVVAVSALLMLSTSLGAQEIPKSSDSCPGFASGTPCLWQDPYCGDECKNLPFCRTTCSPTTASGSSDEAVSSQTQMLYCENTTYANCHYSGPPWATGSNPNNIPLPCKLNADNTVASCKCEVFTGPSYTKIGEILNLGVYYETVAVCGTDGSNCQNQLTCPPGTTQCEGGGEIPPVCKYLAQQNPKNSEVSLIPGADLISVFGFAMQKNYSDSSPTSTTCNDIVAADCMTAPCWYEAGAAGSSSGTKYATCACPTLFTSSYTLPQDGQTCNLPEGYVWE